MPDTEDLKSEVTVVCGYSGDDTQGMARKDVVGIEEKSESCHFLNLCLFKV